MFQRLRRAPRGDGGWSLVELQVVLVTLGVLATAGVAAGRDATEQVRAAACAADTASVEIASTAYYVDHGSFATAIDDAGHTAGTLVGAGYLRKAPGGAGYRVTYDPTDGSAGGC